MDNDIKKNGLKTIDIELIVKKLWKNRKLFCKTLPVAFVLASAYILCIPRYYTADLSLAPEQSGTSAVGSLSSLASNFGFNLDNMQSSDAISPLLYPDLMDDNGFISELFQIKVTNVDGDISCNYYEYLEKHQDAAWWDKPIRYVKGLLKAKELVINAPQGEKNPYMMSKTESDIADVIRKNISIEVDKKTSLIEISTKAQDPLVCKILADSVREKLQQYIISYRTNKARIDMAYYKQLTAEAKREYEQARQIYGSFSDANMNITLESFRAKLNDLENDMQLKYTNYSTMMTQYLAARAKVQERTPAFTLVKGAAVPFKPAGPKRVFFVLEICFLAFIGTSLWCIYKIKD